MLFYNLIYSESEILGLQVAIIPPFMLLYTFTPHATNCFCFWRTWGCILEGDGCLINLLEWPWKELSDQQHLLASYLASSWKFPNVFFSKKKIMPCSTQLSTLHDVFSTMVDAVVKNWIVPPGCLRWKSVV